MPTAEKTPSIQEDRSDPRVVGSYGDQRPGPLLLVVGGIHGNEPAGVEACRQLLETLQASRLPLAGRVVALRGNRSALGAQERFLDTDLNRGWSMGPQLDALDRDHPAAEERERRELGEALDGILRQADPNQPLVFLDFHTFSSTGPPFAIAADTLRNRRFARRLGLPLVLGLEERVEGALLQTMLQRCDVALVAEGGNHRDPASAHVLLAVLWCALVEAGLLGRSDCPDYDNHRRLLRKAANGAPAVSEVRLIHAIHPQQRFRMRAGYRNFEPVFRGELLAEDRGGEVRAPESGFVLMPLYQAKGKEGYFLVRKWSLLRRWSSILCRRMRLDALLPLLPGVRRHARDPDTFEVSVPRYSPDLFRFLGYRIEGHAAGHLVFARRRTRTGAR